ncbi:MAG TPA: heme-degrading domain-containing protein [Chloroflexota bacterium]|jgi:uncharacterized protein (UPF0303 family)|nr:heme-degrading domain-containing protein [Chloroflexota bacterium]
MADDARLLKKLLKQEQEVQFDEFTNETAIAIGNRLVEIGLDEGLPIAVDVRRCGQQIFHAGLPGSTADNDAWIERKCRVVLRFFHSSFYMGVRFRSQGTTIEAKYLLPESEFAPHGGAFPVIVRNVGVVGCVTVSGLAQEKDHDLVVRVLRGFIARPTGSTHS